MADVNKRWAALVARWDEIEASFLDEAGLNWCKGKRAPNTYRMMCEAIDSANVELRRLRGFSRRSPRTQGYAYGSYLVALKMTLYVLWQVRNGISSFCLPRVCGADLRVL